MALRLRIGTSGWSYGHWRGVFYPEHLPADDWLAFYARHFDTVEVNRSFYSLPASHTVAQWCGATPGHFRLALKASRFITHMKKLKDPASSLPLFAEVADAFGDKLGPVLFQLPPRWSVNPARLSAFLGALPKRWRCAFEFRDPSWHCEEVWELLGKHNAACCIFDIGGFTSPVVTTADFAYVRLHGPAEAYAGRYGGRALERWAQIIGGFRSVGEVWVYFDNDEAGYAVQDALALNTLFAG